MRKISDEQIMSLRKMSKSDFMNSMELIKDNEKIETENLMIKHFTVRTSREFYKEVISNKECTRYIQNIWIGEVKTFADWDVRVSDYENFWLVLDKVDNKAVCGIEVVNNYYLTDIASAQIIWYADEKNCRQDLLVEAIKTIVFEYFNNREFFESEYDLMEIRINEKQPGAAEICRKAGFTKEGVLRNRCIDRKTGEKCNLEVWSLLREKY